MKKAEGKGGIRRKENEGEKEEGEEEEEKTKGEKNPCAILCF